MKRLYGLIAILVVFLGFAFVSESHKEAATTKEVPTVGILQLLSHPALDAIHKGIIHGLAEEGYHVGKNVKIDFQNAENDQSNLKTMSARFVNENADAMIGIATPAAQALANASSTTPVVLGAITDPEGAHLVKNNNHPGNNVTGVSDQAPLAAQLKLIQKIMPNMKTLGIIYTSSDDSATAQYHQFAALCKKEHVNLKAYSIANTNDLNQVSQEMVSQVERRLRADRQHRSECHANAGCHGYCEKGARLPSRRHHGQGWWTRHVEHQPIQVGCDYG